MLDGLHLPGWLYSVLYVPLLLCKDMEQCAGLHQAVLLPASHAYVASAWCHTSRCGSCWLFFGAGSHSCKTFAHVPSLNWAEAPEMGSRAASLPVRTLLICWKWPQH